VVRTSSFLCCLNHGGRLRSGRDSLGRGLDKGVCGTRGLVWSGYLGMFNADSS
jgi:hypothetical protein